MITDYLVKTDDSLCFDSRNDFQSVIQSLDSSVPNRNEGRKSYHRERSSLLMYLKALTAHSQIDFPFCARKSESPDFILTMQNARTIGIEHRDITSEGYQEHLSELARNPTDDVVLLDQFKSGGVPTSEINAAWAGDEAEREWAELALSAIIEKIEVLNKPHFQKLDSYELLLYSNTHLPNIDRKPAIEFLRALLNNHSVSHNHAMHFHSISVIYGNEVWLRELTANDR